MPWPLWMNQCLEEETLKKGKTTVPWERREADQMPKTVYNSQGLLLPSLDR